MYYNNKDCIIRNSVVITGRKYRGAEWQKKTNFMYTNVKINARRPDTSKAIPRMEKPYGERYTG